MKSNSEKKSCLRRAGQYQDEKIEDLLNSKAMALVYMTVAFVIFIIYEWLLWFFPSQRKPLPLTIGCFIVIAFVIRELFKIRRQISKHVLGSLGEKVVADELEKIKRNGFMVIHDFQHEYLGNIDHIVIGRKGVFVLETKYRTPKSKEDRIFYDGENVYTLNSSNSRNLITNDNGKTPCGQSAHAAAELQKMLVIDFPKVKRVQPIVVFPFWEIKIEEYEKRPNVRVTNEKEIAKQLIGLDNYFSDAEVSTIYEFLASRNKQ